MKAYKGFKKDLTCMGYQFSIDKQNVTRKANCVQNGFHCAENPMDCLSYYPDWDQSRYFLVEAAGDLDEDGRDSKVSCTKLSLIRELSLLDFVLESVRYIIQHPRRPRPSGTGKISSVRDRGKAGIGAVIVCGKHPKASGKKGAILALLQEGDNGDICALEVLVVDGAAVKEDTWYTIQDSGGHEEVEE